MTIRKIYRNDHSKNLPNWSFKKPIEMTVKKTTEMSFCETENRNDHSKNLAKWPFGIIFRNGHLDNLPQWPFKKPPKWPFKKWTIMSVGKMFQQVPKWLKCTEKSDEKSQPFLTVLVMTVLLKSFFSKIEMAVQRNWMFAHQAFV